MVQLPRPLVGAKEPGAQAAHVAEALDVEAVGPEKPGAQGEPRQEVSRPVENWPLRHGTAPGVPVAPGCGPAHAMPGGQGSAGKAPVGQ